MERGFLSVSYDYAPVIYNIQQGSEKHHVFNQRHRHFAYELKNVLCSCQSIIKDIIIFVGHVTLQDHVIKALNNCMGSSQGKSSSFQVWCSWTLW